MSKEIVESSPQSVCDALPYPLEAKLRMFLFYRGTILSLCLSSNMAVMKRSEDAKRHWDWNTSSTSTGCTSITAPHPEAHDTALFTLFDHNDDSRWLLD